MGKSVWQLHGHFLYFWTNIIGQIMFSSLCSWSSRVKRNKNMFPMGVRSRRWWARRIAPLLEVHGSTMVFCSENSTTHSTAITEEAVEQGSSNLLLVSISQQIKPVQKWGKECPAKHWTHVFPNWIPQVASGKWLWLSELVFSKIAFVVEQWSILSRTRTKKGLIQPSIT